MYAIVDIETTGGHAESNGITEIAVFIHDGTKITGSFSTLINPGSSIPPYISGFTGITNEMVENAPSFGEVAEQIYDLLRDRVFIAHNVNFDYSFIRHQLQRSGFELNTKKLCTVRLSRKLFPGYKSYSLGNLCASLGIDIRDRHRAGGDAAATVTLFERILAADQENKEISAFLKKGSKEYLLPPNLPKKQYDQLTAKPGVYYFHDQAGKIIYVGKAKNLKRRVTSHFSGNSGRKQRQDFMRNIHSISFTECATELMSLILESIEIKKHWPEFNRALKKIDFTYGLYDYEDRSGYIRLGIDRTRKYNKPVATFRTLTEALNTMIALTETFELCPKLCAVNSSKDPCKALEAGCCHGACEMSEDPAAYNKRVTAALESLENRESYAIVDAGLSHEDKSCILVDNGRFYGMGYIPADVVISDIESVRTYISPHKESFYIRDLVMNEALMSGSRCIRFDSVSEPQAY